MSDLVNELHRIKQRVAIYDDVGRTDSFFGVKFIFELALKEKRESMSSEPRHSAAHHAKPPEENLPECLIETMIRCSREYGFSPSDFRQLSEWYAGCGPQCAVVATTLRLFLGSMPSVAPGQENLPCETTNDEIFP